MLVTLLACSGVPAGEREDEREAEPEAGLEVEPDEAPAPPDLGAPAEDPLLARARGQMRRGRAPDEVREQLLASRDPDHRRAARLLQAVAGETPAGVLPRERVESPESPAPPRPTSPEPAPPQPSAPEPEPTAPAIVVAPDPESDTRLDPPPKLEHVPPGSPLRAWLEIRVPEVEPDAPAPVELPLERLLGAEPLLLRERPPRPSSDAGLIILTRASFRAEVDKDVVWLELVGSGPVVGMWMQPLDEFRVRLTIPDAGAVPAFVAARPESAAVLVLDVARRGRDVELELALAQGWRVGKIERLDNGAAVGFAWSDTLPP